ncbi:MAG: hypothetical protein GX458_01650, partial [Phyllobacteriaceae bacterium]|nr:hypothetical protein [Phyllobacteriaceae bacterium]
LESAEARLAELADPDVRGEALHECLTENGQLIGTRFRNSDGTIRTVDRETFLDVGARLLQGAVRTDYNSNYAHPQFLRSDGTVIGIRMSPKSDVTIEVLRGDGISIEQNTKIHFRGGNDE